MTVFLTGILALTLLFAVAALLARRKLVWRYAGAVQIALSALYFVSVFSLARVLPDAFQ